MGGGVYTLVIDGENQDGPKFMKFLLTKENSLHMLWLIPQFFVITVGDLIVIIVAETKALDQASEFFMFGCLMLIDMALFAFLAYRYTYVKIAQISDDLEDDASGNNNNNES